MIGSAHRNDQQTGSKNARVACQRCRSHKVRCDLKDSIGPGSCLRCQKANTTCVPDDRPPPRRKRHIHKPTYDAELRIRHLEEALMETRTAISAIQPEPPQQSLTRQYNFPDVKTPMLPDGGMGNNLTRLPNTPFLMPICGNPFVSLPTPPSTIDSPKNEENPLEMLLTNGILTLHQAHGFFSHFKNVLLPACPHICLQDVPFEEMRRENPLKLHAIMSAVLNTTAGTEEITLEDGLRSHIANRLHIAMDHDIGMIETIIIAQSWSAPSDESKLVAQRITLLNICHSLCVVNASSADCSQMLQVYRLYLTVFICLAAMCMTVGQSPMLPWSSPLQHAYDELLQNSKSQGDMHITVSARSMRLDLDILDAFAALGPHSDVASVTSLVMAFDAQIEDMRNDLFTNPLLIFTYYTLKFNLHDRTVRALAKGTDMYTKSIKEVMFALHGTVEYFISCKHVLDTFPTYVFYKPTKAILSMFKYGACDLMPENLDMNARKYIFQLEDCLLSAPKSPSVKRSMSIARLLRNRFCNDDGFPAQSIIGRLYEAEVKDSIENQKREEDWNDFIQSFTIQESEMDFWEKSGL